MCTLSLTANMAVKLKCQNLANFRKCIQKAKQTGNDFETESFLIINIRRYLSDPKHVIQVGCSSETNLDVHELTLSDQTHKMKVILADNLNKMVQTCKLQAGNTVQIMKCRLHYDETDLSGISVVIVEDLDVTGFRELSDPSELSNLQWCQDCSHLEQMDIPLTSSRGYYISLWSTMEMFGNIWKNSGTTDDLGDTRIQDIYSIKEISQKWNSLKSANPALLVKVLSKSRMIHYAKPGKNDKWPFQAHVLIGDNSGCCNVVLWNATCPNFYYRIKNGSIMLLKKFTVKKSFQFVPRFKPVVHNLHVYDTDVNINSHHPVSEVKFIDASSLPEDTELPPLQWNFVTRKLASGLPHHYICDIAGVVTYVGRYEREAMYSKFGTDTGGFWVRRWIQLTDGSSKKPFHLQLYKLAEGMKDVDIHPGCKIVCSHVRVIQNLEYLSSSHSEKQTFFTTTAETEINLIEDVLVELPHDVEFITKVKAWASSHDCEASLLTTYAGGYVNFPQLPSDINSLKSCMKNIQIVTSSEWKKTLSSLSYREYRQIAIQATLVYVKLNVEHCSSTNKSSKSPKKARLSDIEVILNNDVLDHEDTVKLGVSRLDPEVSFPCLCTTDNWSDVKQGMQFPATEISVANTSCDLQYNTNPYFAITWSSLSSEVLLNSHLPCDKMLGPKASFVDILAGSCFRKDTVKSPQLRRDLVQTISSVQQCSDRQFLVILDCYQGNQDTIEIIVNRAMPVN